MANKFQFEVTAVDRFTKIFRNLNNEASRALRPLNNQLRATRMLTRELHLPALARGFTATARAAEQIAAGLGKAAAPLTMITGLGAGAGVVALIAGLGDIATKWASQGAEVERTARAFNVSTDALQRWRGAARLADLSADDATASIAGLASTVHEAQFGRNPQALMMLDYLGVSMKRTKDGALDLTTMLVDLSRAVSKYKDPQTQAVIASSLGVSPLLPLLREGPGSVRSKLAEAGALGGVRTAGDIAAGADLQAKINRAGLSASGAGSRISGNLKGAAETVLSLSRSATDPSRPRTGSNVDEPIVDPMSGMVIGGTSAQVDVNVKVSAPAGTTVTARSNSSKVPVRVGRTGESQ